MIIHRSNSNKPVWKYLETRSDLPSQLELLSPLVYNLWWTWQPHIKELFKRLDPQLWELYDGNPLKLLRNLTSLRIEEILADHRLLYDLEEGMREFNKYMERPLEEDRPSISYFCMEYGLTHILKIYSGGLGVLAGDYLKEASDSRVKMHAVGLLYKHGYFKQSLDEHGNQIAVYEVQDFDNLPITKLRNTDGTPMELAIPFLDSTTLYAYVWLAQVGCVKLFLLDTNTDSNAPNERKITDALYGGDWENRLRQEYLLGIGGVLLLKQLGIESDVYHMNEGHGAFMNLQRLAQYVEELGVDCNVALELVRASSLYTVHTPVPAGHDNFDQSLINKYLGSFPQRLGITHEEFLALGMEHPGAQEKFSMSILALNTCVGVNGVAKLHGMVSQKMFASLWPGYFPEELHVGYVTNGVHLQSWAHPEWQSFFANQFGADYLQFQDNENLWSRVQAVPNSEIRAIRTKLKERLVRYIRRSMLQDHIEAGLDPTSIMSAIRQINSKALIIGFSRRFATYKRAHLLFSDTERLAKIVNNPDQPVQFLFAGKAHPADGGGQGLIKHIIEISKRPEFLGKIIFLPNYDIELAQTLIPGVDVWLNTPTRLMEASGTSGMKAELNGVLNLSVLDGWWYEGYKPSAGWGITEKATYPESAYQDKLDALTIYDLLETEVIPTYFANGIEGGSDTWIGYIKNSLSYIAPHFTMRRMLDDYYRKFYYKLSKRSHRLRHQDNALAKELVNWKQEVVSHWDNLQVLSVETACDMGNGSEEDPFIAEKPVHMNLVLDCGSLQTDLVVEFVVTSEQEDGSYRFAFSQPFREILPREGSVRKFDLDMLSRMPGKHQVAVRIRPHHQELPYPMDLAYIKWVDVE